MKPLEGKLKTCRKNTVRKKFDEYFAGTLKLTGDSRYVATAIENWGGKPISTDTIKTVNRVKNIKSIYSETPTDTVPQYIIKNKESIDKVQQTLSRWSASYEREHYQEFKVMKDIYKYFPEKKIQRADIIKLMQNPETLYTGFIASMIWGVISATLPQVKSDATTTPLYRLLEFGEDKTVRVIDEIKKLLEQGQVKEAFESMMDGKPNKLPGVGYAYFTKLFFFLGQAYDTIELKPLIFDKWMANAYCALLSQVSPEKVKKFYRSIDYTNKIAPPRTGKKLTQTYESYIIDMKNWAEKGLVCPGKLEEFLFGYARKNNKENPRVQLWKIIESLSKDNS